MVSHLTDLTAGTKRLDRALRALWFSRFANGATEFKQIHVQRIGFTLRNKRLEDDVSFFGGSLIVDESQPVADAMNMGIDWENIRSTTDHQHNTDSFNADSFVKKSVSPSRDLLGRENPN